MSQVAERWLTSENGLSVDWQNPQSSQQLNSVKVKYVMEPRMYYDKDWISPGVLCPLLEFF